MMNDSIPEKVERETQPHEELYNSITHLEESALAALKELRQHVTGDGEASNIEDVTKNITPNLENVLKHSPDRIYKLNDELFAEIGKIRQALFNMD